ncbi:hypothetical protein GUJ93_ZPchr0001g29298 [Zizania palustris]|uniref:MSP domain-containing protein n=1 Tax=Zizania palustris TaxID=103762 RepID=A0A8J5V8C6_ZIZPA|nr:hypothetical protein GUJ93_ZPchr0001g29298 [Zizania palustris]
MGHNLFEIHPLELQFTFEVKKQSSCSVHLVNKSNEYVAFKVKTTSPKSYHASTTYCSTRHAIKDKFLVQTTVVPYGTSDDELVPAFFSKESGRYIEESKLRVVLISASHPLVEQPINGILNTEAAVEVPSLKEMPNIQNEVSVTADEHPHLEEAPVNGPAPTSPVKETPILREVPAPASLVKETPVLREVPTALKETPVILTESPPPLRDTPAITIGYLPHFKQSFATLKEYPLQETLPKAAAMLSEEGTVNVQNRQLCHVTEDVQNLKSKLNNLEQKLEEAERMIIKLRQESRSTTQERDMLQQEMVFLQKKGTPRNQVGFPLLFVVYIALLGTFLGHFLRL